MSYLDIEEKKISSSSEKKSSTQTVGRNPFLNYVFLKKTLMSYLISRELCDHFVVSRKQRSLDNSFHRGCEKLILLDFLYSEFKPLQNDIKKVEDIMICDGENCGTLVFTNFGHGESRRIRRSFLRRRSFYPRLFYVILKCFKF